MAMLRRAFTLFFDGQLTGSISARGGSSSGGLTRRRLARRQDAPLGGISWLLELFLKLPI
jgi:hypothetical protein